ncbi:Hypothetical predicted protein [Octopus vulgaris]|uniref:Uncharacterized protein n=1 Tax=Octopus vulgaris TaxID=6645 RepID=A0AA36BQG2_OCTVU|nr:Hypothetical predicted protein [Octopus vulgaris]
MRGVIAILAIASNEQLCLFTVTLIKSNSLYSPYRMLPDFGCCNSTISDPVAICALLIHDFAVYAAAFSAILTVVVVVSIVVKRNMNGKPYRMMKPQQNKNKHRTSIDL